MGLTCLHSRMTVSAMTEHLGFTESAAQAAGSSNAAGDGEQSGQQVYAGVKASYHPSTDYFSPIPPIGAPEIPRFGGMSTMTIGAAPGSLGTRDPHPDSRGAVEGPYSSMMSSGRKDLTQPKTPLRTLFTIFRKACKPVQPEARSRPGPSYGNHSSDTGRID